MHVHMRLDFGKFVFQLAYLVFQENDLAGLHKRENHAGKKGQHKQ